MENVLFDFISRYMTLSEEEKQGIIDSSIFKTFAKGVVLLKAGAMSDESYFVLKGCLRCYYIIDDEEKTTAFYTEIEGFSPVCSIKKTPSEYYVSCVEDSIILVSTPDMERAIFEKFPRFETLCRLLSEELLAQHQSSFDDFKNSNPEQRYLNLLHTRPDLLARVPLNQLASYLGIKPESLSRIRKRLTKQAQS